MTNYKMRDSRLFMLFKYSLQSNGRSQAGNGIKVSNLHSIRQQFKASAISCTAKGLADVGTPIHND